jgi:predicted GIY-YIG superfamily endonuclease
MKDELQISDGKWTLYVLECQHGYKYVGITKDINRRMHEHSIGEGAHLTKLHKPLRLIGTYELGTMSYEEAEYYEYAYTLRQVITKSSKWRGGRYCKKINRESALRAFEKLGDKYRAEIKLCHDITYHFKKPKMSKKNNSKIQKKIWIKKAEAELREANRRRFGSLN